MSAKDPDHARATGNPHGGADPVVAGELHRTVAYFVTQRPGLFRIALRVTGGDTSSAEDVVQEAWIRWQRTNRGQVRNPEAFLATTTTRLAINVVQSASHRHERPSVSFAYGDHDGRHDPAALTERTAEVADAIGLLLARLSGSELAAYLLRRIFDYPYAEIARLLRTSPVNTRQLVHRARARVTDGVVRSVVRPEVHQQLVSAFLAAARGGELRALERLLTRHVRTAAADPSVECHQQSLN